MNTVAYLTLLDLRRPEGDPRRTRTVRFTDPARYREALEKIARAAARTGARRSERTVTTVVLTPSA